MPDTDYTTKLIIKAARRYNDDLQDTRHKGLVRSTRIGAFGEVAADVLGIAMTPFEFEMAIVKALALFPIPNTSGGGTREAAAKARSEWATAFVAEVLSTLD